MDQSMLRISNLHPNPNPAATEAVLEAKSQLAAEMEGFHIYI